jgi:hypothetical protein
MAMTEAHLASIETKIADLAALRDHLAALLASCRRGTLADCHIIDALLPRE